MKCIVTIIILIITLITNISIAQEKMITAKNIDPSKLHASTLTIKSTCLEGVLFAVVISG